MAKKDAESRPSIAPERRRAQAPTNDYLELIQDSTDRILAGWNRNARIRLMERELARQREEQLRQELRRMNVTTGAACATTGAACATTCSTHTNSRTAWQEQGC